MRVILVFILLAFSFNKTTVNSQQTTDFVHKRATDNSQQTLCTSDACSRTVDCCPLSVDYYESQISKADSLYKNYLPQYNFDEVKAAMEFFDSLQLSKTTDNRQRTTDFVHWWTTDNSQRTTDFVHRSKTKSSTSDACSRTVDRCPLSVDFNCAKAHYYHAVGLTERDDIVGACEHYLIALEIMDEMMANDKRLKTKGKKSVDNPEDYEKIRFVALIYTRLGRLFLNENYCDLAIIKYRKTLEYVEIIDEKPFKANVLKELGNSYHLSSEPDSALYYYNESLRCNSSLPNKLDVEKSVAQILINKGERDSAYMLLKNNLYKINNDNVKFSYHFIIGDMYYHDEEYDSALYYLEESLDDSIISKKLAFTTTLSAIYDSLGNAERKSYYNDISNMIFKKTVNNDVNKSKLQVLYNNYNERKTEKENAIAKAKTRNTTITISLVVLVAVMSVIIYIRYNHRKLHNELKKEIDIRTKDIESKNSIINQKEQLINEYQRTNESKDEIIVRQSEEIQNLINEKEHAKTYDIDAYYNSEICRKILGEKEEKYTALSASELSMLLDAANENLDNIINKIKARYPQLNTDDMYYICLIHLNISKNGISYLMNRSRKTVWLRIKTIKSYMNLDDNDDLLAFLKSIV